MNDQLARLCLNGIFFVFIKWHIKAPENAADRSAQENFEASAVLLMVDSRIVYTKVTSAVTAIIMIHSMTSNSTQASMENQ
jgi:hypothetical protein